MLASLMFFTVVLFRTDIATISTAPHNLAKPTQFSTEKPNSHSDIQTRIPPLSEDDDRTVVRRPQYPIATNLTKTATIVIELSGELGNNLHHIAHGIGLQYWANDRYGIKTNLVLRHTGPSHKWKSARDDIRGCFPKLADWKFNRGNLNDFTQRQRLQQEWLGKGRHDQLMGLINSANASDVEKGLGFLAHEILTDPNRPLVVDEDEDPIRIPFLFSQSLDVFPMIDKYYSVIRDMFHFNDTACCGLEPALNDSVFHFRNYQSEMPEQRAYEMGFQELSPQKVTQELFGHLESGDQVKITTRILNRFARAYVESFAERGVNASLVTDQTGVQDFCFLKRTTKELAGSARSTFVLWASLLGNATTTTLYHSDNYGLRRRHPNFWGRFTYSWTNAELKNRVKFQLFQSEELEGRL